MTLLCPCGLKHPIPQGPDEVMILCECGIAHEVKFENGTMKHRWSLFFPEKVGSFFSLQWREQ
jgi:hypothetical protein